MKELGLLLCFVFMQGHASAKNKITGSTVDGANASKLEYVNVQLLTSDSVFIKGTVSDTKGKFSFTDVDNGNYLVCSSYMGYEISYISICNLEKDLNIGDIPMNSASLQLEDVTITASPVVKKTDRQIILPSQTQVKASSNGLTLLQNLQLSRIAVNPIDNSIQVPGGDNVQLRINGAEVTQSEIIALKPADIIRIEYHDNPGLRYGNAGAVLDYIVKRKESGGNISGDITNGVSILGYGEYNLAAKYNYRKSQFSTILYWGRRDFSWIRENYDNFNYPDHTLNNKELGEPTKVKYDDLSLSLNYSYQYEDKQLLNITFRNKHTDTPNPMSDRISNLYQEDKVYSISDRLNSNTNIPSLDIYYQRKLKNNQNLYFDVVGTYLSSSNNRQYRMAESIENKAEILSRAEGDKYSIIGEGIYEKQFKGGKLTSGIKHTQSYLKNTYTGDVNNTISMNTAETYAFAEYQSKIKNLSYIVGVGAMRTYNSQEGRNYEKYIFRPSVSLSYNINQHWFIRYNGYISGYSPSLSDLNDVTQSIDSYQTRKGNPGLKAVTFYANTLTASWQSRHVSVELFGRYSYDNKPIMENTYFENGKFIRTMENHKGFHRINLQTTLQILPFKEYVAIKLTPFLNRYIGYGNNYTHTHSNIGLRGSLIAMYKNWALMAEMNTSEHVLWGETLTKGEKLHTIKVGYNTEKWNIAAGVLNPFTKKYEQEIDNLSGLAPNKQIAYSTKLSPIFMVNVSFNLDFGKGRQLKEQRIKNNDTDTGILSGTK